MNTTPPKMLNQFPYNLRICLLHGFVPVSASFIVAAIIFAQSKGLRRALLAVFMSMYVSEIVPTQSYLMLTQVYLVTRAKNSLVLTHLTLLFQKLSVL